jgi:hypothetical protein
MVQHSAVDGNAIEQLAASDMEFVMVNGILASLASDRRWT